MSETKWRKIIVRPILSEKSNIRQEKGVMCFEVARQATKVDVRTCVEKIFGVKVEKVRTMMVRGKTRRFRMTQSKRPDWKKAYVMLRKGEQAVRFEDFVVEEKS